MKRLSHRDAAGLLNVIDRLSATAELPTFRQRLVDAVPNIISCDSVSYNEINTKTPGVMMVRRPAVKSTTQAHFAQYWKQNPVIAYYDRTRDTAAHKISDFVSQSAFARLELYNEYYRHVGIECQIGFSISWTSPLYICLAVNRERPRDFSERDRLLLDLLRPHVVNAYITAAGVTRLRDVLIGLERGEAEAGIGVVLLEGRHIAHATSWARECMRRFFGKSSATQLPSILAAWVDLTERLSQNRAHTAAPQRLVREVSGHTLVVRFLREGDRRLLILDEEGSDRLNSQHLIRVGLTPREAEVMVWVGEGKTNHETATILGISPKTVQHHLEAVFRKLGVESRTAAVVEVRRVIKAFGVETP